MQTFEIYNTQFGGFVFRRECVSFFSVSHAAQLANDVVIDITNYIPFFVSCSARFASQLYCIVLHKKKTHISLICKADMARPTDKQRAHTHTPHLCPVGGVCGFYVTLYVLGAFVLPSIAIRLRGLDVAVHAHRNFHKYNILLNRLRNRTVARHMAYFRHHIISLAFRLQSECTVVCR